MFMSPELIECGKNSRKVCYILWSLMMDEVDEEICCRNGQL